MGWDCFKVWDCFKGNDMRPQQREFSPCSQRRFPAVVMLAQVRGMCARCPRCFSHILLRLGTVGTAEPETLNQTRQHRQPAAAQVFALSAVQRLLGPDNAIQQSLKMRFEEAEAAGEPALPIAGPRGGWHSLSVPPALRCGGHRRDTGLMCGIWARFAGYGPDVREMSQICGIRA